jgi:hypothetical protein
VARAKRRRTGQEAEMHQERWEKKNDAEIHCASRLFVRRWVFNNTAHQDDLYWKQQLQFVCSLKGDEFFRTVGVYAEDFATVVTKFSTCHTSRKDSSKSRRPNNQGRWSPYTDELCVVLLLMHYHRKVIVWDLYLMWHIKMDTLTNIINKAEVDMDKSLERIISMLDAEERKKLAQLYNLPVHQHIVYTVDGTLLEIKKSVNKVSSLSFSTFISPLFPLLSLSSIHRIDFRSTVFDFRSTASIFAPRHPCEISINHVELVV